MRNCVVCGEEYDDKSPQTACLLQFYDEEGNKLDYVTPARTIVPMWVNRRLNLCVRCTKAALFGTCYIMPPDMRPEYTILNIDENNLYL